MPHVELTSPLPGITGLLNTFTEPAAPIRDLTQVIMRGENTLSFGERELIASAVCVGNSCEFCSNAHIAAAARYVGSAQQVRELLDDQAGSSSVSSDLKLHHLLSISRSVGQSGKNATPEMFAAARMAGATDQELHDTVLIAALFSLYNRYVDGMATDVPADASYYETLADRLTTAGYVAKGASNGTH
ncbi:MAG: carboxymuconolactone decarboxylase [Candidatus Kapabacteria bacterium]|nr:carboxymuconolactone decarboxylase [Candidatus Kapabacteria bacterium]